MQCTRRPPNSAPNRRAIGCAAIRGASLVSAFLATATLPTFTLTAASNATGAAAGTAADARALDARRVCRSLARGKSGRMLASQRRALIDSQALDLVAMPERQAPTAPGAAEVISSTAAALLRLRQEAEESVAAHCKYVRLNLAIRQIELMHPVQFLGSKSKEGVDAFKDPHLALGICSEVAFALQVRATTTTARARGRP